MKETEQAFVDLITQHQGIIHKVCSMYCDQTEARTDLFQEILLQLWRAYGSFKGQSRITTWMYRVALNTAISRFRKEKRSPSQQQIGVAEFQIPQIEKDPEWEERRQFLYKAINHLSQVEKAIIMLYLEEHSYDEIAEIIGITRTNVGVKINRIKTKLKKIMIPHFG